MKGQIAIAIAVTFAGMFTFGIVHAERNSASWRRGTAGGACMDLRL